MNGNLQERKDAATILTNKGLQHIHANPDEGRDEFIAWLTSIEWHETRDRWCDVLRGVSREIAGDIWRMYEDLR